MNHRITPTLVLLAAGLSGCQTAIRTDLNGRQSAQFCRDLASLGIPCQPMAQGNVRVHRAHAAVARAVLHTLRPADTPTRTPQTQLPPTPHEVARQHEDGLCAALIDHTGAWRCEVAQPATLVLHAGPSGLGRPPFEIDGFSTEIRSRSVQVPSVPALRALGPLWIAESWRGPLRVITAVGAMVAWACMFWSLRQHGRWS